MIINVLRICSYEFCASPQHSSPIPRIARNAYTDFALSYERASIKATAVSHISNSLREMQVGSVSRVTPYIFDGRTRANHVVDANTPFAASALPVRPCHKSSWPTSRRVGFR